MASDFDPFGPSSGTTTTSSSDPSNSNGNTNQEVDLFGASPTESTLSAANVTELMNDMFAPAPAEAPTPAPPTPAQDLSGAANNGNEASMASSTSTPVEEPQFTGTAEDDMEMGAPMGGAPLPLMGSPSVTHSPSSLPTNTAEEDEEFLKAQQAALEAEKIMLADKKAVEVNNSNANAAANAATPAAAPRNGPLGFGLVPKLRIMQRPGFLNRNNQDQQPQMKDGDTAPWNGSAATSDYGVSAAVVPSSPQLHQPTATPTNNNTAQPPQQQQSTGKTAAVVGASVVGGVAGMMLVGPVIGIAAAGGAAYAAATKEGPAGSAMRGVGTLAAKAGGAAKRFDDKHHIVGKTATGVATGVGWVVKTINKHT